MTGMFGSLTRQAGEAIEGSPAAQDALGGAGLTGAEVLVRLDLLLLCLMATAFVVQWVGTLREEETQERLEVTLSGTTARPRWLAAQAGALLIALAMVGGAGALSLALTTAWSMDDAGQVGRLLTAAAAYLPAVLVVGAAALALFGARPRWLGLAWAWVAATGLVALVGPAIGLPDWVLALAPTTHVGQLPSGSVDEAGLTGLVVATVALTALAFVGLRRRDIPQH
jgi:ABC-2 type transport system permease protein